MSHSDLSIWDTSWPLLRDVSRTEPPSPGVSPLASPREARGSLQAATAVLLGFTFRLVRYGDLGEGGGFREEFFLLVFFSKKSAENEKPSSSSQSSSLASTDILALTLDIAVKTNVTLTWKTGLFPHVILSCFPAQTAHFRFLLLLVVVAAKTWVTKDTLDQLH